MPHAAPSPAFLRRLSLAALLLMSSALAQSTPTPSQPPAPQPAAEHNPPAQPDPAAPAPAIVLRAELASRYLAVDDLFIRVATGDHPPTGEKIAAFNRQFDDITTFFFSGRMSEAVRALHDLERELAPRDPMPKSIGTGLSLRVEPRVWWVGAQNPRLTLRSFAPAQATTTGTLAITAVSRGRPTTLFEQEFSVESGKVVVVESPLPDTLWPVGETVRLIATLDNVSESAEAAFSIVESSLDALRDSLLKRLDAVIVDPAQPPAPADNQSASDAVTKPASDAPPSVTPPDSPRTVTPRAIEIARARLAALTDAPSDTDSAQFLADPPALARQLTAEVEAIEAGRNPYARRAGAYQRPQGRERTPCMIHAPDAAALPAPLPLVIALHGMGGDDSMFIRGYGGGLLCRLADQKNFIVAAPLTYKLAGNAAFIDALVDDLASDYAIDRDRVYVLGHSLGGGVAMYLAQARASSIAAAVCIAGAGPIGKKITPCPTLVIAAELDRLAGPARVRPMVQPAVNDRKPVEYREVKNYGHTFVVGRALPEVVDWLLTHSLASRPPREPPDDPPTSPTPPKPAPEPRPELKPVDVKSNDDKDSANTDAARP